MLSLIIATMGAVAETTPATAVPTVATLEAGTCSASSTTPSVTASLRVSWTITNPDATNYSAKLYENGILKSTQDTAASLHWDKTITGNVENGIVSPWTSGWTYRVDVVDKFTSAVVSSQTSLEWAQDYGGCTGSGLR